MVFEVEDCSRRPRDPGRYPTEIDGSNMTRYLLPLLCLTVWPLAAVAQSTGVAEVRPAPSPTMISYLNTGMLVGIEEVDGTASVRLSVYTEEDYAAAVATTKLGHFPLATTTAKRNPVIKLALDAYMTQNNLDDDDADRIRVLGHRNTAFGTIDAIGDDYLLIGLDDDMIVTPESTQKRRRIIPIRFIGAIFLDATPVRFFTPPNLN